MYITQWICSGIIFTLNYMRMQVKTLSDLTWGDLVNQWFRPWGLFGWKNCYWFWGIILICAFSARLILLLLYMPPLHPDSCQTNPHRSVRLRSDWEILLKQNASAKFQMAVFLHILLGINKHVLNNIHWAWWGSESGHITFMYIPWAY